MVESHKIDKTAENGDGGESIYTNRLLLILVLLRKR